MLKQAKNRRGGGGGGGYEEGWGWGKGMKQIKARGKGKRREVVEGYSTNQARRKPSILTSSSCFWGGYQTQKTFKCFLLKVDQNFNLF